jgi:hypothetical protein
MMQEKMTVPLVQARKADAGVCNHSSCAACENCKLTFPAQLSIFYLYHTVDIK